MSTTPTIPIPTASPRSTGYKVGDEVSMYGKSFKVAGLRPDGSPILDMEPIATQTAGGTSKKPLSQTTTPQTSTGTFKRGKWLSNRLTSLYDDPTYKRANGDVQNYYKRLAYNKWVVPYYKHIKLDPPSLDNFLKGQGISSGEANLRDSIERQSRQNQKQQLAMVGTTDRAIAGISSLLGHLNEILPVTQLIPSSAFTPLKQFAKTGEDYYDRQAQDMEDRIQDLGGHNVGTRTSQLIASAALFEATGAAKGSNFFKIANPRTAEYSTRLLKSIWNGAVTGLFWGASTGSKPKDLPDDAATFALFGILGATGTKFVQFLRSFTKVAPPSVIQATINDAAKGLLTDGVVVPKQETFDINNVQSNKQAATAGVARILNIMAWQAQHTEEAFLNQRSMITRSVGGGTRGIPATQNIFDEKLVQGAFKKLSEQEQKQVVTKLFSMLSTSQDVAQHDLAKSVAPQLLEEQENNAKQVAPSVAQTQQSINKFIQKTVPNGDVTKMKLGAVLPHHNTDIRSPLQQVSARMSWLRNQLKNEDLIDIDRRTIQKALDDEKKLYKRIKEIQIPKDLSTFIKQGGGDPVGRQPGSDLVLFNDPQTKSTLAMHEKDIVNADSVREHMAQSRLKFSHKENVEIIKTNLYKDAEQKGKDLKAEGFRYAAKKRQLTGELTAKERLAERKKLESNYKGKNVIVKGESGIITGVVFGKIRVKFNDGSIRSIEPEDIQENK